MLAAMEWLTTLVIIIVFAFGLAILAVLLALVWRQGSREGSTVEMLAGETVSPRPPDERRRGEFTE